MELLLCHAGKLFCHKFGTHYNREIRRRELKELRRKNGKTN